MIRIPGDEPCGCRWGSADFPCIDRVDLDPAQHLTKWIECIECGAVWSVADDNAWVTSAESAP